VTVVPENELYSTFFASSTGFSWNKHKHHDWLNVPQLKSQIVIIGLMGLLAASSSAAMAGELDFTLSEPYGVNRFGYPLGVPFTLPDTEGETTKFQLRRKGEIITAQFRPERIDGEIVRWWVDFAAVLEPLETVRYTIVYGADVESSPERKRGHALTETDDAFRVANEPYIEWIVPKNLRGLLRSVKYPPLEHLRPEATGLWVRDHDGTKPPLGGPGTVSRVVRQGPAAVALRFEKQETAEPLAGVSWTVDLIFPARVSWVEVDLNINDPQNRVAESGWQLKFRLDEPTNKQLPLVDLGAARTVYGRLRTGERMSLQATPRTAEQVPWTVFSGTQQEMRVKVTAPEKSTAPVEGWAHVMDRRRCLALAIDDFAVQSEDRLSVDADGQIDMRRIYPKNEQAPREKRLRSWFHFVLFPHQASAATSPQSMQNPPIVKWEKD